MSTIFERQRTLQADPEDARFWQAAVARSPEPMVLVRDLPGRSAEAPAALMSGARCRLADPAVEGAGVVTNGEPSLLRILHAAVAALVVARATGQVVVTVVVPAPEGAAVVAMPLTVEVTGTFRELLAATRAAYLAVAPHTGVPLWTLYQRARVRPTDVAVGVAGVVTAADAAELGCTVHIAVDGADVVVSYRSDMFTAATAARLATAYAEAFDTVLTDPGTDVTRLLAASERERSEIDAVNSTGRAFPATRLLHSYLEEQADLHPDRVAVTQDGTTYAELNRDANRLANRLRELGVGRGDVVGVCLPRSRAELVAIYGVLKAGGCYLPIDATLPRRRIEFMVEHSGARMVIGDRTARAVVIGPRIIDVDDPAVLAADAADPAPVGTADDLAYVIYTSGSTGVPKGVMIEHRAIVNRLAWMQRAFPLTHGDVVLHKTPFTFDVSVWEIFWWSLAGAAVATLPSGAERDPRSIVTWIAEQGVTTVHFVPSMLQAFLGYLDAVEGRDELAGLRTVFASGEALGSAQVARFRELLDRSRLVNLYGPTEAAVDVSWFDTAEADLRRAVPIGRPIDNTGLWVLGASGAVTPIGTPGELCISGAGLARGYLSAPELSAQRFVEHPELGRIYRTGDLARWRGDGLLEFLGRIDSQVKVRGYRIELGEIEHVASRLTAVAECAVTVVGDGGNNGGERALCAYVVPGGGFDAAAFTAALAEELPSYMVPQWVVEVDVIPTGHNGKRDLRGLPAPGLAGSGYVEPRTDVEWALARTWQDALGVERVGVHDSFFALGGDSIRFIAVLAAARAAGLDMTFQQLFANPTIAELADVVTRQESDTEPPARPEPFVLLSDEDRSRLPADAVDAYPMSALQVGLLYEAERAVPHSGMYHDVLGYDIDGSVDVETFRSAVAAVTAQHPIMRTSFHLGGFTEPVQVVHRQVPCPLTVHDLSGCAPAEQDERLRAFRTEELAAGFRAGEPDLVRVHLHLLGRRGYRYTLSYHDAALDGWSVNTIHRDVFEHYFALLDSPTEPARPTGQPAAAYTDFLRAERAATASTEQRDFWLGVLDRFENARIPRLDGSDGSGGSGVMIHDVAVDGTLSAALTSTAAALNVPLKSVLLAAHVAVLGFVCGRDAVRTGYEHSGRPEVQGGERLAGLFLNTVPFGVAVRGTWADLARDVYRTETELLPYRRFPMAEMKRAAGTREPLFESVFNFTHFHVLKQLSARDGFGMVRSIVNAQTEFPFRAEFAQDAITDAVQLSLHYDAAAFDAERIARIGGYYAKALTLLGHRPHLDVHAGTLLDAAELVEITGASGARLDLPAGTFVDRFAEQVAAVPDEVALVHRERRLTYRELDEISATVAGHLRADGVRAGSMVVTVLDRGVDWAVTVLALLKVGAVYLPQELSTPMARLGAVVRRSGSRHVVVAAAAAAAVRTGLAGVEDGMPAVVTVEATSGGGALRDADRPDRDDPAYTIFTSGSTGEPKGAVIRHLGMLNHLLAKQVDLQLGAGDRIAQVATQCFDISVWQLIAAWLVGGRTVIVDHEVAAEPGALVRTLASEEVTVLELVPAHLDAVLAELERRPVALPALRCAVVTGEALPPDLTGRWFARFSTPLVNAYGPTEASDDVAHHVMRGPVDGDRVPVGTAVLNTGLHVVDGSGRRCPVGTYGEIIVTGPGVGAGYVNDPARTAAAFQPNVLDDRSATMYRTGDIGRWLPGGVLDCAGRVDHQVKVRGFRIELAEIEGAVRRLPGVDAAAVVVQHVNGNKLLAAFHTGRARLTVRDLRDALAATLPAAMHPDSVRHLDAFPLTANGKVDRARLAGMVGGRVRDEPVEPADADERLMLATFASAIGKSVDDIGVTDNFFDAGGHSVAAMKVAVALGGGATVRDLLAHPTARGLVRHLRDRGGSARDLLVDLTAAAGSEGLDPTSTIVCVPYAGGSAASYLDLARHLHPAGARVFGVELPGRVEHDPRPAVPAEQLGAELAAEIAARAVGPVVLLGHCAGAGPVLTAGRVLHERGVGVARLVIVAKVLRSIDPREHTSTEVMAMSEGEILRWLVANTGFDQLDGLAEADRSDLARAFRYDTAEASHAFAAALRNPEPAVLPITVVYALDDPLVRGHEQAAGHWARFGRLDVRVAPDGGHYLNVTRPEFLAACVLGG